jgi:hypothetical protein
MGTTYYLARPDNHTLFDMDRAFGLELLMPTSETERVDFRVLYLALHEWYGGDDVTPLMRDIQEFAQGRPVYFISEHHKQLDVDVDDWYEGNRLRVVGRRHKD